jgi:hypothetical protein
MAKLNVRKTDPRTSVEAAIKAAKSSRKAFLAVEQLMTDGVARIDEEIWLECRNRGFISSLSTVQHARLALSEAGLLTETGTTRPTTLETPSREWVYVPNGHLNKPVVSDGPVHGVCPVCGR